MTVAGPQPTPPATILSTLLADVAQTNPGYTSNLPGSLIEDISSTDVAAIVQMDLARVDLINSLTPFGANAFLLNQLGQVYGVAQGTASNTSVYVVFTGPAGFVIGAGFTVSDGTNQYAVQDGGIIGSGGTSPSLLTIATQAGSWAVPAASVTQLITSVPTGVSLSVTNPNAGTPGGSAETLESYRARVLMAGLAAAQGMPRFLKTLLGNIPGVRATLIAVRQIAAGQWQVLCGGSGDPYQIGYAIFNSLFDISSLAGSQVSSSRNVTVTITDYPDTYSVVFVAPPAQTVTMTLTWNTTATNFISSAAVASLGQTALAAYVNGLPVGAPMNLFELQTAFQNAISSVLDPNLLTRMVFTVDINGTPTPPESGTGIIAGDPESSFACQTSGITITQG